MIPPNPRALIVEDDSSWQEILSELFTDSGLIVDIACTLEDTIPLVKAYPHRLAVVDLSLADHDPHNTDGLQVLEIIRHGDPNSHKILLTGFATVELAVSAMTEHGAFTVLSKECLDREDFNRLIQRLLASAPAQSVSHSQPDGRVMPTTSVPAGFTLGVALVVDDDAGWQSLLSELLSEAGYQTQLCRSFGEAAGYLRRETFTLAVVDLSLAGIWSGGRPCASLEDLEGYRLLAHTRSSGLPTIVVSGVATPTDIQRIYTEQGIFAYLEKQTFDRGAFLRLASEARQSPRSDDKLAHLTGREYEVLQWLAQGLTNKEIADKLVITPNTVKRHLKAIFEKLDVNTRAAAAAKARAGY